MGASKKGKETVPEPEGENDPIVLELEPQPKGVNDAAAQYERNMKIIRARIRRTSWPKIAAEHGLTVRRCQQIFKAWGEGNHTLRHAKPLEIVDEMLNGLQAILEDLGETAQKDGVQDSVRVGALNSMRQTWREIAELLQAVNVLPRDLGTIHHTHDIEVFSERVLNALDAGGFTTEQKVLLLDALGGPTQELVLPRAGDPSQN